MATPIEEIEVVLDVVDEFSETFGRFVTELSAVERAAAAVDDIHIDVDVDDDELNKLMRKLGLVGAGASVSNVSGGGGSKHRAASMMQNLSGSRQAAAKAADGLFDTLRNVDLRMSDLHNLLARLIPLIIVIIGTLPAAITGLVALGAAAVSAAAALAALGGLGALGAAMIRGDTIGEGFQDIISDVRSDFLDAFAPMAEMLAPLFERGLRGLSQLFEEIARRGGVLMNLRDEAVDFGQFVLDYLPDVLANMGRMVEAFGPIFSKLGDYFQDAQFLEYLSETFARMLPEIAHFTSLILSGTEALINLSIGFMQVVNAIGYLLDPLLWLMNTFPNMTVALGALTGALLVAVTAFAVFNSTAVAGAISALTSFGSAIIGTGSLLNFLGASAVVAYTKLQAFSVASGLAALSIGALTTAILGLLAVSGVGLLLPVLGGIASKAFGIGDGFDSATKSLKDFKSEARDLRSNPYSSPDSPTRSGDIGSQGRGGTTNVTVNVEGSADDEEVAQSVDRVLHRYNTTT